MDSPVYDCSDYTDVPLLDAAAVLGEDGTLTLFAVNRDMKEDIELTCDLRAFGRLRPEEHILLHHDDVKAVNTETDPDNVKPKKGMNGRMDDGTFTVTVPALSWNVIRLVRD